MKKLIFLLLAILLITPIAFATTDEIRFYGEQNQPLDVKDQCFNDGAYCSNTAVCNLTIYNPDTTTLLYGKTMTNNIAYHNWTLNTTETANLGVYEATVMCTDGADSNYDTFYIKITPNGQEPSTSQGLIYCFLLIVATIFLALCLYGSIAINGDNEYDLGGNLMKVNVNKHFKTGLFFLAYLFLIFLSFLAKEISYQFLWLSFTTNIFGLIHLILWIFLAPMFIGLVVISLIKWTADIKIWEFAKRGLKPR